MNAKDAKDAKKEGTKGSEAPREIFRTLGRCPSVLSVAHHSSPRSFLRILGDLGARKQGCGLGLRLDFIDGDAWGGDARPFGSVTSPGAAT